jgi:acyl-CoA reductase-like NAD-dependent aldehyde dehydrogenase
MSPREAAAVVKQAATAFPGWSKIGPTARRAMLLRAADAVEADAEHLTSLMMAETAAAPSWCHFNVRLAAGMLREAGAIVTQITGEVIPSDKPGLLSMAVRQAAGVVVGIAPWNAPIILATRAIAVPLACGNTAVLKASELCPSTHERLIQTINTAGFPEGTLGIVTNAPEIAREVVEALIVEPAVRRVSFTGSTRVGRIIGQLCGYHLKPALLELGGKAPLVVLDDADLDAAARAAGFGAFMHQGQICMSTERIVVQASVADHFVAKLAAKARSLKVGDPRKEDVALGALISSAAAVNVRRLIDDAVSKGATLVCGGEASGPFMHPAVVDHVRTDMAIYHEESFGPSVSVIRVTDEEAAVRVANDTEYGLSAAVFSRDIARALRVGRRIQTGICHINGPTVQDEPQVPFGGVKGSGYGRFGGKAGIDFFTDTRWITVETEDPHYPI